MESAPRIHRIPGKISNMYLIEEERLLLVDTGSPNDFSALAAYVTEHLKRSLQNIDCIVPTHAHVDHLGNAERLRKMTKARVVLPRKRVNAFHGVINNLGFLRRARATIIAGIRDNPALILHPGLNIRSLRADIVVTDGMPLPGHPTFKLLCTPGHSPESICLYHAASHTLLSGDTLVVMNGKICPPSVVGNRRAWMASIEKLKAFDIRRICPGHGDVVEGIALLGGGAQTMLGDLFR